MELTPQEQPSLAPRGTQTWQPCARCVWARAVVPPAGGAHALQVLNTRTGVSASFQSEEPVRSYDYETELQPVPQTSYQVEVSNGSGGDWYGKLFLTLIGTDGRSKEVVLSRW